MNVKIITDRSNVCVEILLTQVELDALVMNRQVSSEPSNEEWTYVVQVQPSSPTDWRKALFLDGRGMREHTPTDN